MAYKLHLPDSMQQNPEEQDPQQMAREKRRVLCLMAVWCVISLVAVLGAGYNYMYLPQWTFVFSRMFWGVLAILGGLSFVVSVIFTYFIATN